MAQKYKVAPKVRWATVATFLGVAVLLAVLQQVQVSPGMVSFLPDVIEPAVLAAIPAAITFLVGYQAKHQVRSEDTADDA